MSINEIKDAFSGEKNIGETLKTIGGAAVNLGVDMVIGTALAAYLNPRKGIKRALGSLGVLILSMKAGDVAEDYFCELIDDLKTAFGKVKKEVKEAAEEAAKEPPVPDESAAGAD